MNTIADDVVALSGINFVSFSVAESSDSLNTASSTSGKVVGKATNGSAANCNGINGSSSIESCSDRSLSNDARRRDRTMSEIQAQADYDPNMVVVCPRTDLMYDLNKLNVKIADLGNSCWVVSIIYMNKVTRVLKSSIGNGDVKFGS